MSNITKKVQLEGNHTVWAHVYRGERKVAYQNFSFIFIGCMFTFLEPWALKRAYRLANKWADSIIKEEKEGFINESLQL